MSNHVHSSHRIRVAAPADRALMFFTPAGEELWVDDWAPTYLSDPRGVTQEGLVFTTGAAEQFTIWHITQFDRATRRAQYVRTTPALRTGFVRIACDPAGADACEVTVTYSLTALTPAGEKSLASFTGDPFRQMIDGWADRIAPRLPQLLQASIR